MDTTPHAVHTHRDMATEPAHVSQVREYIVRTIFEKHAWLPVRSSKPCGSRSESTLLTCVERCGWFACPLEQAGGRQVREYIAYMR